MGLFKYDWVNVIDLEATCYEHNAWPEGEEQDIIEVGIAEVDLRNSRIGNCDSLVVRPLRSKVSPYCTELTGWTQEAVNEGMTLLRATQILQEKYDCRNRLFISQGDFDRTCFIQNCQGLGIPYPFKRHLNIAAVFSLLTHRTNQCGMMRQLSALGLEHEGRHHNGADDAKNIARIVLEIIKRGQIKI